MTPLSLRARLTLWYTLALLVVLCLFGANVLWQQRRIGIRRVDRELEALTATLANVIPLKALPPSLGMRLMRMPPSAASAETPAISMDTSCVAPRFGL